MGKLEYLDALKRAMAGLPPELQARTLAYYEQCFVDAAALGRPETAVAEELGEPKKIAMTLRANAHLAQIQALQNARDPVSLVRTAVSAVGLGIFNLFMVVPALVYGALLASLFAAAMCFYVGGIAITASGLAGANELLLQGPFQQIVTDDNGEPSEVQTRININETGIHVRQEKVDPDSAPESRRGVRIETDVDTDSRTTQTFFGIGLVLGGIALFLLSLVITRYTLIGIRRYVHMNLSLLKGS